MQELGIKILTNYGLVGLCISCFLGFFGWVIQKILNHLMSNIEKKDSYLKEMAERFNDSLDSNTQAIYKLSTSHEKVLDMTENFHEWLKESAEESKREHIIIIDQLQRRIG